MAIPRNNKSSLFRFFLLCCLIQLHGLAYSQCVKEFGQCVMPRDCCEGLNCVAGDWEYTTDSTCLSPKSETLENRKLAPDEMRELVEFFYEKVKASKQSDEVDKLVQKYASEFPQLVARLERKYETVFDVSIVDNSKVDL